MRKILLVLLVLPLLAVFRGNAEAQAQQEITQFLPHFAAGRTPVSEWNSVVSIHSRTSQENWVKIEFFDSIGQPVVLATDKGTNSKFLLKLSTGETDVSINLEILRSNAFSVGWERITSTCPVSTYLTFRNFLPGESATIGQASVFASPTDLVLNFPLDFENGVALVNPGTADANVKFVALDKAGNKIKEGAFPEPLKRGYHVARYFSQEPFFLNDVGEIIISSNIPLSGIALDLDGLTFSTLPSLSPKRRLDNPYENFKINTIYIYPSDKEPQRDVAKRVNEAFFQYESMMRRELRLYGTMAHIPELPVERDENGLPTVFSVKLSRPGGTYVSVEDVGEELRPEFIKKYGEKQWKSGPRIGILFYDMPSGFKGTGLCYSATGPSQYIASVQLSGDILPFLNSSYLENKQTFKNDAEYAFFVFGHELEHCLGLNFHVGTQYLAPNKFEIKLFQTLLNPTNLYEGCFNPIASGSQCVLSPMEASILPRMPILNLDNYNWTNWDRWSPNLWEPYSQIISKELVGNRLKVVLRISETPERDIVSPNVTQSGIHSIWIESGDWPLVNFWKLLGHDDDLNNIIIDTVVRNTDHIWVRAVDYHGNTVGVKIF